MKEFKLTKPGFFLPLVIGFAAVFFIIIAALVSRAMVNLNIIRHNSRSTSSLNVAEAGINYYLWHLSHNNKDYCDGNTCVGSPPYGPFSHDFKDTTGNIVGNFKLYISPPSSEGSVVNVRSEGTYLTGEKRTIVASLGIPSFARYSFVTNSEVWFGDTEQTKGLVHSNAGIHFDGTADSVVAAAVQTYRPSSCFGGDGQDHNGVWGSGGPNSFWQFPVPQIDFNQLTSDLSQLQTTAIAGGIFLPTLVNSKGQKTYSGYAIQLKGTTFRLGRVTAAKDNGGSGGSCSGHPRYDSLIQSVSWESSDRNMPGNGVIFVADNLWVWGNLNNKRLTIASGRLPDNSNTNTNIFLLNDITYSAKDGSSALGLIAQSDIVVNSDSENNLELDAFVLSQKGHVFRPYYSGNVKNQIYVYGGIGSNSWWTWSWVNGSGSTVSGYQNTIQEYDSHLSLDPPPNFPTTGSYAILSWKEEPII